VQTLHNDIDEFHNNDIVVEFKWSPQTGPVVINTRVPDVEKGPMDSYGLVIWPKLMIYLRACSDILSDHANALASAASTTLVDTSTTSTDIKTNEVAIDAKDKVVETATLQNIAFAQTYAAMYDSAYYLVGGFVEESHSTFVHGVLTHLAAGFYKTRPYEADDNPLFWKLVIDRIFHAMRRFEYCQHKDLPKGRSGFVRLVLLWLHVYDPKSVMMIKDLRGPNDKSDNFRSFLSLRFDLIRGVLDDDPDYGEGETYDNAEQKASFQDMTSFRAETERVKALCALAR
jgi:hypothetical protein